ncbi:hypothetical protein CEQ90_20130 [Lewinellaceae bacterium SD302]|nr:hypothetical protein CEQ90_20130 [Lewinellaceae bacterium SD302]
MRKMLEVNPIANAISQVYNKSIKIDLVKLYFPEIKYVNKWLFVSDYSFSNIKTNDVISFSFIPHVYDMFELSKYIRTIAPKDIKRSRSINTEFSDFLRGSPILNFSIIIRNHRYLSFQNRDRFKESLIYSFDGLIKYFDEYSSSLKKMIYIFNT